MMPTDVSLSKICNLCNITCLTHLIIAHKKIGCFC